MTKWEKMVGNKKNYDVTSSYEIPGYIILVGWFVVGWLVGWLEGS